MRLPGDLSAGRSHAPDQHPISPCVRRRLPSRRRIKRSRLALPDRPRRPHARTPLELLLPLLDEQRHVCRATSRRELFQLAEREVEHVVGIVQQAIADEALAHPVARLPQRPARRLLHHVVVVLHHPHLLLGNKERQLEAGEPVGVAGQHAADARGGASSFSPGLTLQARHRIEILLRERADDRKRQFRAHTPGWGGQIRRRAKAHARAAAVATQEVAKTSAKPPDGGPVAQRRFGYAAIRSVSEGSSQRAVGLDNTREVTHPAHHARRLVLDSLDVDAAVDRRLAGDLVIDLMPLSPANDAGARHSPMEIAHRVTECVDRCA